MKRNTLIVIGIILIGIFIFAYQGFSFTNREKVIDIIPNHITVDKMNSTSLTHQKANNLFLKRPKRPTGLVIRIITNSKNYNVKEGSK